MNRRKRAFFSTMNRRHYRDVESVKSGRIVRGKAEQRRGSTDCLISGKAGGCRLVALCLCFTYDRATFELALLYILDEARCLRIGNVSKSIRHPV